jgi:hypothetical protein
VEHHQNGDKFGWTLHQMDFKSALLNGYLKEDVYMTQPPSFEVESPRAWYTKMDEYIRHVGFDCSESGDTLYYRTPDQNLVIIVIYVDDLIITGNYEAHIKHVKQ